MPLVEYRCEDCGHAAEFLVKMDDEQEPACPECGSKGMRRLISTFAARVAPSRPAARCERCPNSACPMK